VAMEMFEQLAGVKMLPVPYKAMSEATTALAGGQVDFLMNDAGTVIPFYKSGRLRPLATTGTTRMAALPNVPTFLESGVPDYELTGWFATYFPVNTPPAATAAMRDILHKAVRTKPVAEMLANASFEPMDVTGDQLTALQRKDSAKWGKLLRPSTAR
jgi:tripartite-type tricarboxylate transporter receptor subunit TctC